MTPRTPLFWGENTWKSKNCCYHQKGQVIISKWPRFQPHATNITIFLNLKKKVHFFTPREIWLKPKSCLCSIYHNFVKNYYFDLNLDTTFHYDVLKGFFDSMIRVVVSARSRLAFFCNWGWLLALFSLFFIKHFDMNIL